MAETIEIIQNTNTESKLDTAKEGQLQLPFYKPVNVISQIYKWQPMGKRVVINLPLLGDDRSFLFLIRCSPLITYIPDLVNNFGSVAANRIALNFDSVVHDIDWAKKATDADTFRFSKDPGVHIVTHSTPPFLSDLAYSYRYWKGGLQFRLRTRAGFTHNAILFTSPIYGSKMIVAPTNRSPFNYRHPVVYKEKFSYLTSQGNSYTYADLSMTRHFEVGYNFMKPVPYEDTYARLNEVVTMANSADNAAPNKTPGALMFEDYIGVGLRGSIDNSSAGSNQIEFEIDVRAAEDFQFSGENVFLKTPSDSEYAMDGMGFSGSTYGTVVEPSKTTTPNRILPRKYQNPWFTSDGKHTKVKWYQTTDETDGYYYSDETFTYD